MHIRDIFAARRPTFSFEFFPPKTAEGAERGAEKLP
jgi:methylenetetrahydrofolate reductase (NADPH)